MAGVGIGNFYFNPASGTLPAPGTFTLANFQARPLPDGASLSYTNTPFYIDVMFTDASRPWLSGLSSLMIKGVLNGTATGSTYSNVVATVTSVQSNGLNPLPFSLDSFSVLSPQTLAPAGINGGTTAVIGQLTSMPQPAPIPEPTPLALLGILAIGAAMRSGIRWFRRRG
jgi:hypothetical protein